MKSAFFSVALAITAVVGPAAAKTCSAQPIFTVSPSLEWLVADSDVVVRATVADLESRPAGSGMVSKRLTLKVVETLKGESPKSITIADEKGNDDETYELWRDAKTESLWFLRRNAAAADKANDKPKPELPLPSLNPDMHCWAAIRLGPATGGKSHRETSLAATSMNFQALSEPRQILAAARAAAAEGGKGAALRSYGLHGPIAYIDTLIVPIDRRLEKLARRLIESPDDFLSPQPALRSEKEERLRLQFLEYTRGSLRAEGAKSLRFFKSAENIALLKPLLEDSAYRILSMGESREPAADLREYFVRNEAFITLRGWGVDVAQPVLREWAPTDRVYRKEELPANGGWGEVLFAPGNREGKPRAKYYFTSSLDPRSTVGAGRLPGLYRSDEDGKTWRLWCVDFAFKELRIHPETGVLFAAIDAPSLAEDKQGFLRPRSGGQKAVMSSDGKHWKDITPGRGTVPVIEGFEIDPDHPRRVGMYVDYMTERSVAESRGFFVQPLDDEYVKWDWHVVDGNGLHTKRAAGEEKPLATK